MFQIGLLCVILSAFVCVLLIDYRVMIKIRCLLLFLFVSINYNHHHMFKFCSWISSCCGDFNGRSRWIYASLSPATAPTSVSPSIGTIRFSLDINVYFVTKCVKRWHKYVSLSNSSNTRRWWKYACEKMRYTRRHTEPSLPTDASLMEILCKGTKCQCLCHWTFELSISDASKTKYLGISLSLFTCLGNICNYSEDKRLHPRYVVYSR